MNTKVQEFINKMKIKEMEERNETLISLGLIDESRTIINRRTRGVDSYTPNSQYDKEKKQYYVETKEYAAIEVTDEEYNEILKYAPFAKNKVNDDKEVKEMSTTWASAIKITVNILLAVNIIGGFILYNVLADDYDTRDFAWIPIVSAILYCILYYPLLVGFSKIVAVAERKLQE